MLLDDEIPGLTYLKLLCDELPNVEVLRSFNDPILFLKEHAHYEADFYILDIEMPGINGLELAKQLNKPIIFTTAYKEYAADAFDLAAVDYIRKPVKKERLEQAIEKLRNQIGKQAKKRSLIQLNTNKGKVFLDINVIVYISTSEIDSRDKSAQLLDGSTVILKNYSLDKLLAELPEDQFAQVNRKELIALPFVVGCGIDYVDCAWRQGSRKLILSESFRKDFLLKVKL